MGKCLDLTNGTTAAGTIPQIWKCTDNDVNQVWDAEPGPSNGSAVPFTSSAVFPSSTA